ncbi:MAG: GIY-YIG nuclease family protein [Novosphingobium sp.]
MQIGVYALCDLDGIPIYVGQSVQGIRARVRRHLTSARSDVIANRQVDVWEVAWVKAWPVTDAAIIPALEAALFHAFDAQSPLMNGSVPVRSSLQPYDAGQTIQVMSSDEIARRLAPAVRLPRQIEHYGRLVDHYLNVKDSAELRVSMEAHFERLKRYHHRFLEQIGPAPRGSDDLLDL